MNSQKKKILVAPLDWGLGHATRCIPVVRHLTDCGAEVVLAASGRSKDILKIHFPNRQMIDFPGYRMTHPVHGSFAVHLARKSGSVFRRIREENEQLKQIVKYYKIDAVISDNRYGLHHPDIPCVLITHQLNIQAPWPLRKWLKKIVRGFVQKYDQCWVPDFEGEVNLSGKLSHVKDIPFNVRYIGPLSRFDGMNFDTDSTKETDVLAIISGPEPQRSYFEQLIRQQLTGLDGNHLLICGRPNDETTIKGNVKVVGNLPDDQFATVVSKAKHIVCRPGYSTLMDLYFLKKGALLIPTPGQTEQEYLAKHWSAYCQIQDQKKLDLTSIKESDPFPPQPKVNLKKFLSDWLENIS